MDDLKLLAEGFPNWSIWRARAGDGYGDWYATRKAFRITDAQLDAGLCMTVCAATLDDLAYLLNAQTERQIRSR
ncbi:hypothetical protein [Nonomuraea sp. NPDC050310]|uniref:hypothetical protein n=1 Tax=Nonomuraea sp. NPDC050310 TaxID=3154935 RepID=UPI0033CB5DF3